MADGRIGGDITTKDSQPDNKKARMENCTYQTPNTEENHNENKNAKIYSIENWAKNINSRH